MSTKNIHLLFQQARKGQLPKNFNDWFASDENGWTIAHSAISSGKLPISLTPIPWDTKTNSGWSLAHEAAMQECLPVDFDDFEIATLCGATVAEICILHEKVPEKFNHWHLIGTNDEPLAHTFITRHGFIPSSCLDLSIEDSKGRTLESKANSHGQLSASLTEKDDMDMQP